MMCTPRREIRIGSPAGSTPNTSLASPVGLPCARNDPEPSQLKARPSAAVTRAIFPSRDNAHPSHGMGRSHTTSPARPCPRSHCDRLARLSQVTPAGDPSGASIKRGGSLASNVKPTVDSPVGSKTMSCAAVGGDRGEPVGTDGEVFDRRPQLVFPDPATGGSQAADPVAFLNQGQAKFVGLDGQMRELDQTDVETAVGVALEVEKHDLAVGRGRQPARRGPEDPADPDHVGPLAQLLARRCCRAEVGAGW